MGELEQRPRAECGGDRQSCTAKDCPIYGPLKANNKVKGCQDLASRNGFNRTNGLKKQNQARKKLGIAATKMRSTLGNEENWSHHVFATDVKSGKQAEPIATFFIGVENQIMDAQRAFGRMKQPARVVVMPESFGSDGIVMVRVSAWNDNVERAFNQIFGGA